MGGSALALAWAGLAGLAGLGDPLPLRPPRPAAAAGRRGAGARGHLGLVVVASSSSSGSTRAPRALETKSNAHTAAVLVDDRLAPGDLVVAVHPEQGPVMHFYLPKDSGCAGRTRSGPVADPRVMDWRDALDRLKAASRRRPRTRS